ncbi:MAG TPA: DNA polymerase I [Candidatus Binataceae bacterium]|nr:DNA polymerase I [Candidatus Binataceae bacterium]
MAEVRRNLVLVDGSGYVFRAFHALPELNNSSGLPVNAIYGFIRMLMKLLKDTRPTHIAVVFDSAKKTFRDDLFGDYKKNRVATPSDLLKQIPYIHRAVDAFRIKTIMRDGYEADDVIGTLATRAAKQGIDTVIVTSDKDFKQIVSPRITLWDTMGDKRTGVREVKERFGVEPRALIDIQALTGDPIDNVKGIPGVGEKTASTLIQKFGDLDNLYAHLVEVPACGIRGGAKVAALLKEHRADVDLARQLVKIRTDMPLDVTPEGCEWGGIDEQAATELIRELEFTSMLQEIRPSQVELPMTARSETPLRAAEVGKILAELSNAPRVSLALLSNGGAANGLQLHGTGKTHVLSRELIPAAAPLLTQDSPPKACHDLKAHLRLLGAIGINLRGADFDTMLAGFLINSGRPEPSLDDLYHEHLAPLGRPSESLPQAEIVASLRDALAPKLAAQGLEKLFKEIELPIAVILAEMEAGGVGVDASALKGIADEFGKELARLEMQCYRAAGRKFNLNSPIQLREILFSELKLPVKGIKKSKSGYSTDADTLEKLASAHPLPRMLLEFRALAKLKSTYADALGQLIDPATGRIHTTLHQAIAATGRLSSSDPNLQNIPTRSEAGRRIRRAFVAQTDHVLLSADYSQIDLRVLAHLSGDPTLVAAFQGGEDIHMRTAMEVLGVPAGKVDAEARRLAKVINFGIIYGMGATRLAGELGISLAEASDYIKRYFERLAGVSAWFKETLDRARKDGYVTTMFGRRRYLPELNAPVGGARAQAERIAINTPIQGSAADLIKVAMIGLHRQIEQRKINAAMVMQVHDELLIEVKSEALQEAAEVAKQEMEGVATMRVPLKVELKWGSNWAEMRGGV